MTTSVETFIDFSALEDEMSNRRCEGTQHGRKDYHADGGEQYVEMLFGCCGRDPHVIILCQRFLDAAKAVGVYCGRCKAPKTFDEAYRILGPVGT